jgi:Bacterial mobilisation protein (MobC)
MSTGIGDGTSDSRASGAFRGVSGPAPGQAAGGSAGKAPAPFSLRLTEAERAALEARTGGMPLGAYIRSRLLGDASEPRRSRRSPIKDEAALARLLGELGNARLANNLNQLAKAVNTGSLPVTPETVQAILTACQDVRTMRACLLAALGFRPEDRP